MCMMAVLQNADDCLLHDVEYILKQRIVHLAAVDDAAAALLRVAAKVERPAAALAVIIPTGPVQRRPDGVWVIPLACLRP